MNSIAELLALLIVAGSWLAGIVLASGWLKVLAVVFPFYAWYLVVERVMMGAACNLLT